MKCGNDAGRHQYGLQADTETEVCSVQDVSGAFEDPAARSIFERLDRDGIAMIDDFGQLSVLLESIRTHCGMCTVRCVP